jgi:hypothetical protein
MKKGVAVPDTVHGEAAPLQIGVADTVVFQQLFCMLRAIDLDDQPSFEG